MRCRSELRGPTRGDDTCSNVQVKLQAIDPINDASGVQDTGLAGGSLRRLGLAGAVRPATRPTLLGHGLRRTLANFEKSARSSGVTMLPTGVLRPRVARSGGLLA
jgi:hypothetical protein